LSESGEETLARLRDEGAIAKVVMNYARGVDRRDFELVGSCFAPGAAVQGTGFSGNAEDYVSRLAAGMTSVPRSVHFVGNHWCEVQGDRARSETYTVARQFRDAEGEDEAVAVGVRYHDEWARQPDGTWAIASRRVDTDWRRIR
jgi:SnoaL-like domain